MPIETLKYRLPLMLLLLSLLPAVLVGWVSYSVVFDNIRAARIADVGQVAEAKHDQLVMVFKRSGARAGMFLNHLRSQCMARGGTLDHACTASLLAAYVKTENATGAYLHGAGNHDFIVGSSLPRARADIKLPVGQLASFSGTGPKNNRYYFVLADTNTDTLQLAVTYPSTNLYALFDRPKQLGEAGETFLADAEGYFITPARYAATQGNEAPIRAHPMQMCLGGKGKEVLDYDYRDVKIIHGFRFVPEMGAGCIMAHISQKEAFAPIDRMENRWALILAALLVPVGAFALYFSRRVRVAEQQVIESEKKFHLLFDASFDNKLLVTVEGDIVDVNRIGHEMLGYGKAEMVGAPMSDFYPPEYADAVRQYCEQIEQRGGARFETEFMRRDGSRIPVDVSCIKVVLDERPLHYCVARDITVRKRLEADLNLREARYRGIVETSLDGFWTLDTQGHLLEVNDAYVRMSGYSREELLGMGIGKLDARESSEETLQHIRKVLEEGFDHFETQHRARDGRIWPVEISVTYWPNEGGRFFVFLKDITERKRAEEELRIAAATFESHEAILITDRDARIVKVNKAFTEVTGYAEADVIGKNPSIMSSNHHDHSFYVEMWQQLLHFGSWSGEIWDRRKTGEVYPKWLTITAIKDDREEVTQYVAIFSDITARKQIEEEMRTLAFYDALTRLPNRRLFLDRFSAALSASARHNDYGAVLFLDMDHFKALNDTCGHEYGDLMLKEVGGRIKSCVREMDTVARFGGDEFMVLIESVSHERDDATRKIALVAEKIREALARPYRLKEHVHHSSPSIGICLFRGNMEPVNRIIEKADLAMYQAKQSGRNAVRFFDA